jgi:metal-dependent hydrolase (beta-lactamase superfamily II)
MTNRPIYALLGGFHLFQMKIGDGNSPGTLSWTAKQLTLFGIQFLLGAHCTGFEAFVILRNQMGLDSIHAIYSTIATTFDLKNGIVPASTAVNRPPQP